MARCVSCKEHCLTIWINKLSPYLSAMGRRVWYFGVWIPICIVLLPFPHALLTRQPHCLLSLFFSLVNTKESSSSLKWAHSHAAPSPVTDGRYLLGAAVPNLCAQCVYDGQVYTCPGLSSMRKWSWSSKVKAAEAVTVLCLTLQWSSNFISPFTGNYLKTNKQKTTPKKPQNQNHTPPPPPQTFTPAASLLIIFSRFCLYSGWLQWQQCRILSLFPSVL